MIRQSQVITVHILFMCVETPRSGGTHLFALYHSPALRTLPNTQLVPHNSWITFKWWNHLELSCLLHLQALGASEGRRVSWTHECPHVHSTHSADDGPCAPRVPLLSVVSLAAFSGHRNSLRSRLGSPEIPGIYSQGGEG